MSNENTIPPAPGVFSTEQVAMRDEISETMLAVHSELVTRPNQQISPLPEHHFIETFLPYFCGEKSISDAPEIMQLWNGIAGSPAKEVLIIDNNGKPLFRVPPMNDTSVIDVENTKGGMGFHRIVKEWMKLNAMLPAYGKSFLNTHLTPRLAALVAESTVLNENEKRWLEIFARYDKMTEKQKETAQKQVASKKVSDDELEY